MDEEFDDGFLDVEITQEDDIEMLPPIEQGIELVKDTSMQVPASNMMDHRSELIRQYHDGNGSLSEKLSSKGKNNPENMVMALVDEVIAETDHLLGNELLAGEQGEIRDASVISAKRADVIQMAIKAVQTKQAFDKDNGIDVNSPAMRIVFRFFMKKVKHVFEKLGYDDEASDVFFKTLSEVLDNWDKQLQIDLDEMSTLTVKDKNE